jgi:hypothetical protein
MNLWTAEVFEIRRITKGLAVLENQEKQIMTEVQSLNLFYRRYKIVIDFPNRHSGGSNL